MIRWNKLYPTTKEIELRSVDDLKKNGICMTNTGVMNTKLPLAGDTNDQIPQAHINDALICACMYLITLLDTNNQAKDYLRGKASGRVK